MTMRASRLRGFVAAGTLLGCLLLAGCKHRVGMETAAAAGNGPQAAASGISANTQGDAAAVAATQKSLLAVTTTEMNTDVPAAVQTGIVRLKDALEKLTDDAMAGMPSGATAAQVQARLTALLPREPREQPSQRQTGPAPADEYTKPEAGDYGGELTASVSQPMPGLLLVADSLAIQCGEDTVLLGYSNATGAWKRVLRWRAEPYAEVSGALGDGVDATLLGVQRNGHPVLLVVHGTPWCTSTMSGFGMDAFEVDTAKETAKPFWSGGHSYRRADDDNPRRLKLTPDGFEMRASVKTSGEGGNVARTGVMRYRMHGATFERTLPIAMNSRETVEEWLDLPRKEAALFTDAPPGSATWKMYDALSYTGKSEKEAEAIPMTQMGEVRACSDSPQHFQVAISTEVYSNGNKTHAPGVSYFVQVQETGQGYLLHDTLSAPSAACNGRVVLKASE